MPGIIVGVDGSEPSRRALSWAIREAVEHEMPLTVMTVQRGPARPATEVYWPVPDYPDPSRDAEPARRAVRELVDKATSEAGDRIPEVTVTVTTGNPAEELVRASHDADLLVVGAHGRGGFATLLMGSVSTQVVHHAACPVVVVREAPKAP
ncbi:MAG TPA: universal stress protein [Streptosporangiaceae bacterium]|nr:universal stress protein [Streptosporangiaceae bacterium]